MNGGFIGGDWYRPENAPDSLLGERDVLVWGYVIIDKYHTEPVQQTMFRTLCTSFTICYATRKSDKGYITCRIWGDEDAAHVATCLEKGDWVFMAGKLKKTKYTVRRGADEGKEKQIMTLEPSILIPMPMIQGSMAVISSEGISKLIQAEEDAKGSDVIESADDYTGTDDDFAVPSSDSDNFDFELSI